MEDQRVPIAISLSPDTRSLINENGVDLISLIRKNGLDVTRSNFRIELLDAESGLKSPELVILASAVAAPLIAGAIVRIIDAINRGRQTVVTTVEGDARISPTSTSTALGRSEHSMNATILGLSVSIKDSYGGGDKVDTK